MPKVLYPFLYENLGIYWVDLIWVVYDQHKLVRFNSGIREKNTAFYTKTPNWAVYFL